jgi:hypothetical protein
MARSILVLLSLSAARAAAQPVCTIDADDATVTDVVVRSPGRPPFRVDARAVRSAGADPVIRDRAG